MVKTSLIHNFICRFNAIPVKFPASSILESSKLILKFIWKGKGPRLADATLKKNKAEGFVLSSFKTYYKAMVIKMAWFYKKKDKQINGPGGVFSNTQI